MSAAERALELRDVRGPSAFWATRGGSGSPWLISVTEFRVRYANTFLGYVWTIVRPLIFFGVIFMVMREVPLLGEESRTTRSCWCSTSSSRFSRRRRAAVLGGGQGGMVRKMQFPRVISPAVGQPHRRLHPSP